MIFSLTYLHFKFAALTTYWLVSVSGFFRVVIHRDVTSDLYPKVTIEHDYINTIFQVKDIKQQPIEEENVKEYRI